MNERVFLTELSLNSKDTHALGNFVGQAFRETRDLYEHRLQLRMEFAQDKSWGMLYVVTLEPLRRGKRRRMDVLLATNGETVLTTDLAFLPDPLERSFSYPGETAESFQFSSLNVRKRLEDVGQDWWYEVEEVGNKLMLKENLALYDYGFRMSAERLGQIYHLEQDPELRRQRFTVIGETTIHVNREKER